VQACFGEIAKEHVVSVRLVQRVPVDPKLDADRAGAEERLEDHGQRGFPSVHAGVEEADGGRDLPASIRSA
jgi:hypothetical protein